MLNQNNDPFNAFEAKTEAQKLSFAPIVFHTARTLRDLGILAALDSAGSKGMSAIDIAEKTGVSEYGVKVLLDMAISAHIVLWEKPNYSLANLGFYLLYDGMTQANMDFTADVCYAAMMHLTEAIKDGKPAGLKELGDWETIYQGCRHYLSKLSRAGLSLITSIRIVLSHCCLKKCLPMSQNTLSISVAIRVNGQCSAATTIKMCM